GGWELSDKVLWQSGQYLTPTGNTLIGNRRADYAGSEIGLPAPERGPNRWFNTAAFGSAPDDRRSNAGVRPIQGPCRYTWELSPRKNLRVQRRTRVEVRADLFNAFNHVNFSNPNANLSSGSYGQIADARPPRQTQLSLRLEF